MNTTTRRAVIVSTSAFEFAHGRAPRGEGRWAFELAGEVLFFEGTFTAARRAATSEAARRGLRQISVGT